MNSGSTFITYPDGNLGSRPKDGSEFTELSGAKWVWDDVMEKWVRTKKQEKTAAPVETLSDEDFAKLSGEPFGCECGAHKTYGHSIPAESHSYWCRLYKELV